MSEPAPWSHAIRWLAPDARPLRLNLDADPEALARVARFLDLEAVARLRATIAARPWLDGMELSGTVSGIVTRQCGVSLETFEESVETPFLVRIVPVGSPHAAGAQTEVVIDLEAEDPPDIVEGDSIDVGPYVIEALALALDPFARKPGVVFEAPEEASFASPFDVLRGLTKE